MSQELQQIYKIRSYRKDCGKKIKSSKRTLTWRFGLAKERGGILKGKRKKEHEITLIWSVASGKRIVLLDGLQRHYSQGVWIKDTFQRRWNWKGISIEMIAHSTRPAGGVDLQYDLKLNGTSFHLLPEEDEPVAVIHKQRNQLKRVPTPRIQGVNGIHLSSSKAMIHKQRNQLKRVPTPRIQGVNGIHLSSSKTVILSEILPLKIIPV